MLRSAAGAVLFTTFATHPASAESFKVVVPNRLDGVEGDDSGDVSDFGSFRQQQLSLADSLGFTILTW